MAGGPRILIVEARFYDDITDNLVRGAINALEKEGAGFDLGAYRDAPPGLRIWCGATVEAADVAALTQWLDYAFETTKASLTQAA